MPNTTIERVVTAMPLLTELAVDQSRVPDSFILERVAPNHEVPSYRFEFPLYGRELLMGKQDDVKAVRGEYRETEISKGTDTGELIEHGLKAQISKRERLEARRDEERGGIDPEFQLEVRTAAAIRMQVKRRREYLGSLAFTSPGVYSAGHTDATINPLTDTADDILGKIDALRQKIVDDTGFEPNTAIVGQYTRRSLRRNPDFRGLLPTDRVQVVSQEALAELLGVETVEWGSPVITANADTIATPIYDDMLWIGYIDRATNSKLPTFARTFYMNYEDGRDAYSGTILVKPEDTLWVWYAEMYATVVTGPDLGALAYSMRP